MLCVLISSMHSSLSVLLLHVWVCVFHNFGHLNRSSSRQRQQRQHAIGRLNFYISFVRRGRKSRLRLTMMKGEKRAKHRMLCSGRLLLCALSLFKIIRCLLYVAISFLNTTAHAYTQNPCSSHCQNGKNLN